MFRLPAPRKSLFSFFFTFIALCCVFCDGEKFNVVIINSYHRHNSWTESLIRGETETIYSEFPDTAFTTEYLDLKRFPESNRSGALAESLALRSQSIKADLVIANDNGALEIILGNRDRIYPGTPVVYAGINGATRNRMEENLPPLVTGVAENLNLYSTINTALKLHSDPQNTYVILDKTISGQKIKEELKDLEETFSGRTRFVYLDELEMPAILKRISSLDSSSLVLLTAYNVDRNNTYYEPEESARLIARASSAPVYYLFTLGLGEGVVGGYMLDGRTHGNQAGMLANRILSGEPVSRIPPLSHSFCPPVFDFQVLKKWDISPDLLPEGSRLINKPGFFKENQLFLIHITSFIFVLILTIIILSIRSFSRMKFQKELESHIEDLRVTLNSIGDGVIATDKEGRITRINPAAERLTGWRKGASLGQPVAEVFKTRSDPASHVLTYRSETGLINHSTLISLDGNEYPVTRQETPIASDDGEVSGSVLIFRNITKEIELNEQLKQSEKMNAIGQLAGGIAHDFNNMLSGILGSAELLEEHVSHDSNGEMLRSLIVRSSERAAQLTQKLLAFARKSHTQVRRTDIHAIIGDTVALLENTLDKKIEIQTNLKAPKKEIMGDSLLLQNALMNMGINSSQAMDNPGTIVFSTRNITLDDHYCSTGSFELQPGTFIEIEVRDDGCGIPPEVLPHIFEPFYTTNDKHQGTGLGLAAVYGTVEQHGGAITPHSEVGEGTIFHILLPAAEKKPGRKT